MICHHFIYIVSFFVENSCLQCLSPFFFPFSVTETTLNVSLLECCLKFSRLPINIFQLSPCIWLKRNWADRVLHILHKSGCQSVHDVLRHVLLLLFSLARGLVSTKPKYCKVIWRQAPTMLLKSGWTDISPSTCYMKHEKKYTGFALTLTALYWFSLSERGRSSSVQA